MKRPFMAGTAVATLLCAPVAMANVDVGVSVQIAQPGVYGRIDIGTFPQPAVVVAQPVLVTPLPPPRGGYRPPPPPAPVYMWVPPGHQKDWTRYCSRYNACGVPVYFVRDDWYHNNVDGHGKGKDKGKGKGHGHGHGHD